MKLALLLTFCLSVITAQADCNSHYIFSYPQSGGTINSNGVLLFELYGGSEEVADSIIDGAPAYLASDSDTISLVLEESLKGEYHVTQILLRPALTLTSGKTYWLHIDGLNSYNHDIINAISGNRSYQKERMHWTATSVSDTEMPQWIQFPKATNTSQSILGCGPQLRSNFQFVAKDASTTYVRVQWFHEDGTSTTYIVVPDAFQFCIGREMCRGPFNFQKDQTYAARFKLIDASGNETKEWSERIDVPNPW